jgi:thermitase
MVGMDPMQRSDKVIKIAACDNTKNKATFSNYFKTLVNNGSCLSAPGVSIYSTLPGNQFGYMDGTSMASPMVAGVIGLMKSANKNLTNKQIMRILYDTGLNQQQQKIGPVVQSDKAVKKAKAL